jgi:hypothetical protein
MSAGVAASPPENVEPSDIDTDNAATVVPATALSGRDVVVGQNVTPFGVGGGGGLTANTLMVKLALSLNRSLIPFARTTIG